MAFAVWITGRPASGKSTVARELVRLLHERGIHASWLESDVLRTQLTPYPSYEPAERDFFYEALTHLAKYLVREGHPVVIDATGNLRRYRDAARHVIPRLLEAYVDTPVEVCEARDPKGLYRRAREGTVRTLPGVQGVYESPLMPDVVLRYDSGTPAAQAARVIEVLSSRGWLDTGQ